MNNKKTIFFLGVPVLIFILVLVFTGCDLFNFDKPATPEILFAEHSGTQAITIMWRNVENAENYIVSWSELEGSESVTAGSSKSFSAMEDSTRTVTIEDAGFSTDKTFYFRIFSENSNGMSSCSLPKKVFFGAPKTWTIMVWLDGDNDLNNAAKEDFHEMEAGLFAAKQSDLDIQDHLRIVVQYDDRGDNNNYGRFVIQPRDIDPDGDSSNPYHGKILGSLSAEPNMGDANELKDFIAYTKSNYPADHYGLILWNHGGGVRSISSSSTSREICQDETSNDYLYIGEIKDVLTEDKSVDFLGMDACLMGMTEVAYEFRPGTGEFGAQTMTFSPAEEQGDGWEYQNILYRFRGSGSLDENDRACFNIEYLSAVQLARIVGEEYEDAFSFKSTETQTAVDLTKIGAVKTTIDQLAGMLKGYKSAVEDIRGSGSDSELMHYFDISSGYEWENYASFDLYDLAWRIRESPVFTDIIQDKADELMIVIEDAIIYSWAGSGYNEAGLDAEDWENGLSIFFPDGDTDDAYWPDVYSYWDYQFFYTSLSHSALETWMSDNSYSMPPNYGAIDFCTGDGDGVVESWFELLQYWYNPTGSTLIHPGPMW